MGFFKLVFSLLIKLDNNIKVNYQLTQEVNSRGKLYSKDKKYGSKNKITDQIQIYNTGP